MFVLNLLLLFSSALAFVPRTDKPYYSLDDADKHFEDFMNIHDVNYNSETEKQARFEIFKQNLEDINQRNLDPEQHAIFGVNKFSDLTKDEFVSKYTGLRLDLDRPQTVSSNVSINFTKLPDSFDWRERNVVTQIKDQGTSNTCWTFSTTGTVEGAYAIKHGQLISFSEQQIVDCDPVQAPDGTGLPSNALTYLQSSGGAEAEDDYPYVNMKRKCSFDANKVKVQITGQSAVPLSDDDTIRQYLTQYGPISIGLNGEVLQHYHTGVMRCPELHADHAVLLIGYGTDAGKPYWLIKNSWGTTFGESGYARLERTANPCGMKNVEAVIALVA